MKVIIAGGRDIWDREAVDAAVEESGFEITEVVCGGAPGVDTLGARWAKRNSIPIKVFPAEWARLGRSAGPVRNMQMAKYADALIAVWDGQSHGTRNMIETAKLRGLKIYNRSGIYRKYDTGDL